jgi:diadenosine tetraphosphate (Ap4A) HIT family hydrolase
MRSIAIDWSGAKTRDRARIWMAEVNAGRLVRLEDARSRSEVVAPLMAEPDVSSTIAPCPFCHPNPSEVIASSRHAIALRDHYPISTGHTLIISRTHGASLSDLRATVREDAWRLVDEVRRALREELSPDGFNIGVNEGAVAGQTVPHAHIHVIPRFFGDVPDPRGGIRWVIPEKAAYWEE